MAALLWKLMQSYETTKYVNNLNKVTIKISTSGLFVTKIWRRTETNIAGQRVGNVKKHVRREGKTEP